MGKNIGVVWEISKEDLQEALDKSFSFQDALRRVGIFSKHKIHNLKRRIEKEEISLKRFLENKKEWGESLPKKNKNKDPRDLSSYSTNAIVKKLLKERREYKCEWCGQLDEYNGKPLVLQMDHINGDPHDNREENLRFLCPNCHSQTDTYQSKNRKLLLSKKCECGNSMYRTSKNCGDCENKKTKIIWPSPQELQKFLWEKPCSTIAKDLGVSDKAVEKYAKKHGLTKPARGYWKKIETGKI